MQNTQRQYYLDWLRVITILLVFLFHCNRFFDFDDWHVKNATLSPVANFMSFFMVQWMMPIFFFISGASTWFALQSKTGGKFITDRVKRILVPLVFGIFILSPHQVYLERLSHHQFNGSLLDFLPKYFSGFYAFGGNFAWMGLHLWYLLLLFIFSLIALPLFLIIKKNRKNKSERRTASPLYLIAFVIILALPGYFMFPEGFPGGRMWGGWNIIEHLFLFILGYYAFSKPEITKLWSQYRYTFLILTILLTVGNLYLFANRIMFEFGTVFYLLKILLRAAVCFGWIYTLLGFAGNKLNYTNSNLKYGNEAVLPFYIIHQPVIVVIGYFVIQLQLPIGIKYLVIVLVSFVVVMTLYIFLIKKSPILRYLFGMGKMASVEVKTINKPT